MIYILQWGLERSACVIHTFYETTNPIFNTGKIVLIDNETIAELEWLGMEVKKYDRIICDR